MSPHPEHFVHDKINLGRLVRRLDKSISDWDESTQHDPWIKIQATLQKVKYAKKLLKNVEMYHQDPTPKAVEQYRNTELTLGRIEGFVLELENRVTPITTRPAPLLPSIAIPFVSAIVADALDSTALGHASLPRGPLSTTAETPTSLPTESLLLSSDTSIVTPSSPNPSFSPATLNFPITPTSPTKPTITSTHDPAPTFSQNSNALQQELSNQLAQMAAQLKRNTTHFSESLMKDQAVMEGAKSKIEGNFDTMKTQRVRLRDHGGKSGSTTCLVLMSLLVVAISFVLMFFVIRLT